MPSIAENVRRLREAKEWSQEDLARESRTSQTTVYNIESGETLRSKFLPRIAAALGVPLSEIDEELQPGASARPIPRVALVGEADLPVYASTEGGEGQIIVSNDIVDRVRRPTPLLHVREGYGVIITGTSMVPAFRPGEIALVHPMLPPRVEDAVILFDRERARSSIKEYRGETAVLWKLRRYQPKEEDFTLRRADWPTVHTVVGKYSRR